MFFKFDIYFTLKHYTIFKIFAPVNFEILSYLTQRKRGVRFNELAG